MSFTKTQLARNSIMVIQINRKSIARLLMYAYI